MSAEVHKALILTFAKAVVEVFKTQCSAEVAPGAVGVYKATAFPEEVEITTSIGINCEAFLGGISIGFPKGTYLKLASQVLGENYTEINDENRDFGSEMLNIIFGVMKTNFSDSHSIVIQPALPQVVQGRNLMLSSPAATKPLMIPFSSSLGNFFSTVALGASAPK
jgi:chemotaxis protein CheX